MPAGVEPHDWEPTPKDIVGLESADLFIYNGAGVEGWVDKVLSSLEEKEISVVKTSSNIKLLNHSENEENEEEAHNHGAVDPHTWTSPKNALIEMEEIYKALIKLDEVNADYYEANFEEYKAKLLKLDKDFSEKLSSLPNHEIVVAHEAYGYLCEAYGLEQHSVRGFSPEAEPTPKKMVEIIDFINENKITTIFFEETSSSVVADAIAKETQAEVAVLSPVESLSEGRIEAGEDYFSVMEDNLVVLVKALE